LPAETFESLIGLEAGLLMIVEKLEKVPQFVPSNVALAR